MLLCPPLQHNQYNNMNILEKRFKTVRLFFSLNNNGENNQL